MQLVASGSNQVPAEYLTLSYEQLLQIAQSDYNYSLLLQTYGADLSSSLIVNLR
jgi:microcystin-dependent protein